MPTHAGPNTKGEENLVFGYDLGDTRNSYKGEPTVNLVTDPNTRNFDGGTKGNWTYQTVAGSGSISTENPKSGTHSAKLTRSGAGGEVNYYWNAGPGLSLTPGLTYTFSMDVWCNKPGMAKLFSYLAGTNGSSDFHPGDSKWHRLSMQFVPAASTAAAQIRFGILTSNSNYPVTAYFDNAQIEQNTHVTPFTEGTRSATQGLIDLTGNSTIDLTNVSFDSNAQMTFDGTDDRANVGLYHLSGSSHTEEVLVYRASTGNTHGILSDLQYGFFGLYINSNDNAVYRTMQQNPGQTPEYPANIRYGTSTLGIGYHHIVGVFSLSEGFKLYVNGELESSSSEILPYNLSGNRGITDIGVYKDNAPTAYNYPFDGRIEIVKAYNRALTASEIKANYNAIKGRFNI